MIKVLILREFDEFSKIMVENGFEIVNLPLIETKPLDDLSGFYAKLDKIDSYDGIFLTSRNSTKIFAEGLHRKNINYSGKIYVLGKRSFEILKAGNLNLVHFEDASTAHEMLKNIDTKELKKGLFLFVRGDRSLNIVPKFLRKHSMVDESTVYQTRNIRITVDKMQLIRKDLINNKFTYTCFFSPSGVESFLEQFDKEILSRTKIAAIGKTTAKLLEKQDIKVDFIPPKPTARSFSSGLTKLLGKR